MLYIKYIGGLNPRTLDIDFGIETEQTISDCIEELIEVSYEIYKDILDSKISTTIVCGGQSPSYYCLAMMNFSIYNPDLVNIIILPHSKGGVPSKKSEQYLENKMYCDRLLDKKISPQQNVVIIDGVHTGTGIIALENALLYCYPHINITKIAINSAIGVREIEVDKEYILPCEPKFSDIFPRLVNSYHPRDFDNIDLFITEFNIKDNPVAEMIIDISKSYPRINISETEWYKLNNILTDKIISLKIAKESLNYKLSKQKKEEGKNFKPIIIMNRFENKVYKCPICQSVTGTMSVKNPRNTSLFPHRYDCVNKYKIPDEHC